MKTKAVLILTLFTLAISGIACKGQVSPEEMNNYGRLEARSEQSGPGFGDERVSG